MADHALDTAAQRPATGLDRGARDLILRAVTGVCEIPPIGVLVLFFTDRFGSYPDYFAALEAVWGSAMRHMYEHAVDEAETNAEFSLDFKRRAEPKEVGAYALLMVMPEPDFRLAVENAARAALATEKLAPRITEVCRMRGAPWRFVAEAGFQWVGDEVVERELVRPALAALNDPRFAGGVRSEFESARNELRVGTAVGRKQAVYECGCAVESAMKVVLDERGIAYDARDAAQKLFEHLVAAGLVPRYMERTVLAPAVPRNKAAGHGAGAIARTACRSRRPRRSSRRRRGVAPSFARNPTLSVCRHSARTRRPGDRRDRGSSSGLPFRLSAASEPPLRSPAGRPFAGAVAPRRTTATRR